MNENIFDDVKIKLKKKNQILFDRNSLCLQELLSEIRKYPHRVLALWALECAKIPAKQLKMRTDNDPRVDEALDLCTKWMQGIIKMPAAKKALLKVHVMARETDDKITIALAHSVGQACACVHVETHAIGLVMYEMTALVLEYGIDKCYLELNKKIEFYKSMLIHCEKRCKSEDLAWADFLKNNYDENKEMKLYKKRKGF